MKYGDERNRKSLKLFIRSPIKFELFSNLIDVKQIMLIEIFLK